MRIEILNIYRSESQTNDKYVQKSVSLLKNAGFDVDILPEYQEPEKKAKLFVETIFRRDIDYTWIVRGGIETVYLLPYIDFSLLEINNIIIGASDLTHLALPILKRGFPIIYGTDVRGLSSNSNLTESDQERIFKILKEGVNNTHFDLLPLNSKEVMTDSLIGGTLQILLNLLGTQYCPDLRGRNLYIEHHYIPGESYLEAKYWLNILKLKIDLEELKSLLVGELIFENDQKQADQSTQIKLTREIYSGLDIPVGFLKTSHRRSLIKLG